MQAATRQPRDPPSAPTGEVGAAAAFGVLGEGSSSVLRLEDVVLALGVVLGVFIFFFTALSIQRLAGVPVGILERRGQIALAIVVVLNSIVIGILIAQLGR